MKKKLKVLILIIIILIIFLVGLFVMVRDTSKIELKEEKFIYELGDDITSDISYYLKDADSTKNIKDYELNSDDLKKDKDKFIMEDYEYVPVGKYEFNIKYKTKEQSFVIEVVDTKAPEFISSKESVELEETTDNIDLLTNFEARDLSKVSLSIEGEYDLSKAGEYQLKVVAKDDSDNTSLKDFVLKVNEKKKEAPKQTTTQKSNNYQSNNVNNTQQQTKSTNSGSTNQNTSSIGYRKDISNSYVSQLNAYRRANGLSELPVTSETQNEADRRAKELVNNYSHDGAGYGFGEIIGHGDAGGDFITAWKNSPTHNATMLREQNTAIAASVYEVNGHWYTVVSFRMNY